MNTPWINTTPKERSFEPTRPNCLPHLLLEKFPRLFRTLPGCIQTTTELLADRHLDYFCFCIIQLIMFMFDQVMFLHSQRCNNKQYLCCGVRRPFRTIINPHSSRLGKLAGNLLETSPSTRCPALCSVQKLTNFEVLHVPRSHCYSFFVSSTRDAQGLEHSTAKRIVAVQ